jgi:hypothetical protein
VLQNLLAQLEGRRLCIVWNLVSKPDLPKPIKQPVDPRTGLASDSQDPATWLTPEQAYAYVVCGVAHGVGLVLPADSEFFLVDLDNALQPDGTWSTFALGVCSMFPDAAKEISQSGKGLHIIGRHQPIPEHRTRRKDLAGLEVYSRLRFVALTGNGLMGDMRTDCTGALQALIGLYLPEAVGAKSSEWTEGPYEGWRGGGTDEQIIYGMLNRRSAQSVFGNAASFRDLWEADEQALAHAFPDSTGKSAYDRSAADQSLANHLAFATGYDCERTMRLMLQSALRRDKWDERDDYLPRTIMRAVAGKREQAEAKLREGMHEIAETSTGVANPQVEKIYPPKGPNPPPPPGVEPIYVDPATGAGVLSSGHLIQVPTANQDGAKAGKFYQVHEMVDLFVDHVYVRDLHGIVLPDGCIVEQKQFNAMHGGASFQMTIDGKDTNDAWDAYINNKVHRFPRAHGMVFDPRIPSHEIVEREGQTLFNSWVPVTIPMVEGDPAIFLEHVRKLYPYGNDHEILLAYLAAIVQFKGHKFAWAPLLQGVEGNGKTFFSLALEQCVGARYTHHARAAQLDSNFNSAFYGKLLVCVEDVYISEQRSSVWETLKPMITGTRMEIEGKGVNKVTREVCFNFLMNSNHKSALRKTPNDRRICPMFGAQQTASDLQRSGMDSNYFKKLYGWFSDGGAPVIAHFLANYKIPDALNPAVDCVRAPRTSSTEAAIVASRGSVEQEVIEAIDSGREGFRDGWVDSCKFDQLLSEMGRSRAIPRNQRKELIEALGYAPHPNLPSGRTVRTLADGTRPVLFIKPGHAAFNYDGSAATDAYIAAQTPSKR